MWVGQGNLSIVESDMELNFGRSETKSLVWIRKDGNTVPICPLLCTYSSFYLDRYS